MKYKQVDKYLRFGFVFLIIFQTFNSLYRCGIDIWNLWIDKSMSNWAATDYLINYQGGFVRRGMLGEILYQLRLHLGIDPLPILVVLSIICCLGLVYVFVKAFWEKNLSMYILPLVICLGLGIAARKDYLMILLLWLAVYSFIHIKSSAFKIGISMLIIVFLLNVHEASLFFTWPLFSLLILRDIRLYYWLKCLGVIIPISMFLVLSFFKGDIMAAQAIHDSWKPFLPASWGDIPYNSIDAIGWEAKDTFLMHLWWNYFCFYPDFPRLNGWMIRPMVYLMIFYLISNYPIIFRKANPKTCQQDAVNLSRIMFLQFFMLLPMFTILSNDLGRVVFYWTLSSLVFYLIIPNHTLDEMFPRFYCRIADGFSASLRRVITPSRGLLSILMLLITITPVKLNIHEAFGLSVLGSFYYFMKGLLLHIL